MNKKEYSLRDNITASLFVLLPTIMLIEGFFLFTYKNVGAAEYQNTLFLIQITMFVGLVLLIIGFLVKKIQYGSIIKMLGWIIFAIYWSTQPMPLYVGGGGDIFNGAVCVIGVYVLFYLAYHEWLSYIRKEKVNSLNWITGASAISGLIYFSVERTSLAPWLIKEVARQSAWVLNAVIGNVTLGQSSAQGTQILYDGSYLVTIIFACTAIQAMVIFVGMIFALPNVDIKRKIIGLLLTVLPVYILNLLRNALVGFILAKDITDFNIAHNVIAKAGSLAALIVILLIVVKIIPEIFDQIISLTDIHKRNGPLEKMFKKIIGRKT